MPPTDLEFVKFVTAGAATEGRDKEQPQELFPNPVTVRAPHIS